MEIVEGGHQLRRVISLTPPLRQAGLLCPNRRLSGPPAVVSRNFVFPDLDCRGRGLARSPALGVPHRVSARGALLSAHRCRRSFHSEPQEGPGQGHPWATPFLHSNNSSRRGAGCDLLFAAEAAASDRTHLPCESESLAERGPILAAAEQVSPPILAKGVRANAEVRRQWRKVTCRLMQVELRHLTRGPGNSLGHRTGSARPRWAPDRFSLRRTWLCRPARAGAAELLDRTSTGGSSPPSESSPAPAFLAAWSSRFSSLARRSLTLASASSFFSRLSTTSSSVIFCSASSNYADLGPLLHPLAAQFEDLLLAWHHLLLERG